jgi:hypothetical protein
MSETVDNVEFVGGHAVEQHDAADVPEDRAEELEAAKAAVKKAIEKAGKEGADDAEKVSGKDQFSAKGKSKATEDEDEEAEEKPAKAKAEEEDPDERELKRVLRHREKLARAKQQQNQELAQQQNQLRQMYAQLQREKQAIEQERQRIARLKTDPAAAIRENGWDPEEFIVSLAKEGTEEGKVARLLREQQAQLQEMNKWREEQARQREQYMRQMQEQQAVQARQSVEQQFLGHAMDAEKRPHLADFYKGREGALIAEGDIIAAQYREATGKEASLEDIAEYIEESLAERARAWYEKSARSAKTSQPRQSAVDTGKPAKSRGRTLTADTSSERRSLGKGLADLDGDERLQAAREAVKVALANSRSE